MPEEIKIDNDVSVSGRFPMQTIHPTKKGRKPEYSRAAITIMLQSHSKRAIKEVVSIMKFSKNEALRLEAAKAILNKSIPDVKAVQLQDGNGEAMKYNVIFGQGFIPQVTTQEAEGIARGTATEGVLMDKVVPVGVPDEEIGG